MLLDLLKAPYRFRHHLKYHRDIIKHLRWTGKDALRMDFYKTFVCPADLVFDVGANMGNRSKIFRAIGARVMAFEPQSHCASFLGAAFSGDTGFTLVQAALSDQEGELTMHLSDAHVLSTLDMEWMDRMNQGGRFAHQWDRTEVVRVTTLDKAIAQYGLPAFIKIDVEGHEYSVVRGLSHPVKQLSLEFASESLDRICQCVDHLDNLAPYEYRLSLGETMRYEGNTWRSGRDIQAQLAEEKRKDPLVWGDIYARRVS
jgi:FkbM family methyltransferase